MFYFNIKVYNKVFQFFTGCIRGIIITANNVFQDLKTSSNGVIV